MIGNISLTKQSFARNFCAESPKTNLKDSDLLPQILARLEDLLGEFGPEADPQFDLLRGLSQRLNEGRFHLAVLGQFKRGKSSILNALLGHPILPIAVVPLTAVPTFLSGGDKWKVTVRYAGGTRVKETESDNPEDVSVVLEEFVTESRNPHNRLGVTDVQVICPCDVLRDGLVLIDTPGVGSTLRHNTLATLNFLPQCDAALFVVSADPPITEAELEFLKDIHSRGIRVVYLMNKVDYLTPQQRQQAVEFFRQVLREHVLTSGDGQKEIPVFTVSARLGLEARQRKDRALWEASGLAAVEEHLVGFLVREKNEILRRSIARRTLQVVNDLVTHVQLQLKSFEMPLQILEERMVQFERFLSEAKREKLIADDLLAGDRKRILQRLEERAEDMRKRARQSFSEQVEKALQGATPESAEVAAQQALTQNVTSFFETELQGTTEELKDALRDALKPHQERLHELIRKIRETAASVFEIPYISSEEDDYFALPDRPLWVTDTWESYLGPLPPEVIDRFLPEWWRLRRIRQRLLERVDKLVMNNVENLRWKLFQGVEDAIRKYSTEVNRRLQDTITSTHGAIAAAREQRQNQSQQTAIQKERLQRIAHPLVELQSQLTRMLTDLTTSPMDKTTSYCKSASTE